MKTAIVYYSLEGNTKYAAEYMAKKLNADLIPLKPVTEYPKKGLAKFFHGGRAAVFAEKPELKAYTFDAGKYDKVLLGCPVWAGKCAAPINTFLAEHGGELKKIGGQNIGIFLCQSGNGAQKVLAKYKEVLNVKDFAAELVLIDPLKKEKNRVQDNAAIDEFCRKVGM